MVAESFRDGFRRLRAQLPLAGLIYAVNLLLAFLLSLPVYGLLDSQLAGTGFSEEMARGFDLVLWAGVMERIGSALSRTIGYQLLWAVPLYLVWKSAASVGLIHALRGADETGAPGSFWRGAARHGFRALLLSLLVLLPMLLLAVLAYLAVGLAQEIVRPGEAGDFWAGAVVGPALVIGVLAVGDLMQDYGRIALVLEERTVRQAWRIGVGWPFRHGRSSRLYVSWFAPALLLLLLPTAAEMLLPAASTAGIWALFLLQQLVLSARAAVTVGWFASEVSLFERVRAVEREEIARREALLREEIGEDAPPQPSDAVEEVGRGDS